MALLSKKCLGIDIGVSSIKVVEISASGKKRKLENYAEFVFSERPSAEGSQDSNLFFLNEETPDILKAILKEAGIKSKKAAFSLPDFSTFFTNFNLPPMNEAEVLQAVEFEARHHIPLPLSEVTFDWQILEKKKSFPGLALKILLVAVPNKILAGYQKLANLAKMEMKAMEAEVFGLIRSSLPEDKQSLAVCLVDIGWQSTTVSIVENGHLKVSHSFDISGSGLNRALSSGLNISFSEAEKIKKEYGLDPRKKEVVGIVASYLNGLSFEIKKVCNTFYQNEGRRVSDIILAGGASALFGMKEYLSARTKKTVQIAAPFSSLEFPSSLQKRLEEIGPSFGVAVGIGLMGLES